MGTVPTWNFAVVHATGTLRRVDEKTALKKLLAKLIAKFETYKPSAYDFSKVPHDVIDGMMNGIVGFEMENERLEGKFKLGQERSGDDRASLLENLKTAKADRSIHSLTAEFYKSRV
jgi:transcriptional regulator